MPNYNLLLEKISENKTPIQISTSKSTAPETTTFYNLIEEAKKNNQNVIFTFTPGPFKKNEPMPADWLMTPAAVGCTAQLTAFEKKLDQLNNTLVYAVNERPSEDHVGKDGILASKHLDNLPMISIAGTNFIKEFELPTITVNKQEYLSRFTLAITSKGEKTIFNFPKTRLDDPLDETKGNQHIEHIQNFLGEEALQENPVSHKKRKVMQ